MYRPLIALAVLLLILSAGSDAQELLPIEAFPNLIDFVVPLDIESAGDGSNRLFIGEKWGRIYAIPNDSATTTRHLYLDLISTVLDSFATGLQSFAFHPDYAMNGHVFVAYSIGSPIRTRISRFQESIADSNAVDPLSELVLLEIPKTNASHVGMELAFAQDGYLYISIGDDVDANNAQDLTTLHGSLLRIDVDTTGVSTSYGIPPDNPFAGNAQGYREEIYAYGLRNPWRFSIDPVTGWIYVADVGRSDREEVSVIQNGGNYGWPVFEGSLYFNPTSIDTTGQTYEPPVWEYDHSLGISIIGGYVYRGSDLVGTNGRYIYADYLSGRIWLLDYDGTSVTYQWEVYSNTGFREILSFGVDETGELYLCRANGRIYRVTGGWPFPSGGGTPLAATGGLGQNFPNPFNPSTSIPYATLRPGLVQIVVYDVRGRTVRTLVDARRPAGAHSVEWDGRGNNGDVVSTGQYFYRLQVDGEVVGTQRMLLLK